MEQHTNNQLQKTDKVALQILLPNYSATMPILSRIPATAIEAINSNENQISGLVKNCGAIVIDAMILLLLEELLKLTNSPVGNLSNMAISIRQNFWDLRFEEIVFALNKGINSGYGMSHKNLAYETFSFWLTEYKEVDRPRAAIEAAEIKHGQNKVLMQGWQIQFGGLIEKYTPKKDPIDRKRGKPDLDLSDAFYDSKMLQELKGKEGELMLKASMTKLMEFCKERNYRRSLEYLEQKYIAIKL